MKKVIIIGCPGSGKSTFSIALAKITGLPLVHLDAIYHQNIWTDDSEAKKIQWQEKIVDLVKAEEWIIDGNYKSTMQIRIEAADTIIFLDYPRYLSLWRTLARRWKFRNKKRPDMPITWKEKISWDFIRLIWNYNREQRPTVLQQLKQYGANREVQILRSPQQADNFLAKLKTLD
jgi:adenylate kinase family enzyme